MILTDEQLNNIKLHTKTNYKHIIEARTDVLELIETIEDLKHELSINKQIIDKLKLKFGNESVNMVIDELLIY